MASGTVLEHLQRRIGEDVGHVHQSGACRAIQYQGDDAVGIDHAQHRRGQHAKPGEDRWSIHVRSRRRIANRNGHARHGSCAAFCGDHHRITPTAARGVFRHHTFLHGGIHDGALCYDNVVLHLPFELRQDQAGIGCEHIDPHAGDAGIGCAGCAHGGSQRGVAEQRELRHIGVGAGGGGQHHGSRGRHGGEHPSAFDTAARPRERSPGRGWRNLPHWPSSPCVLPRSGVGPAGFFVMVSRDEETLHAGGEQLTAQR